MAWLPGQRITAARLRDNAPWIVDWSTLTSNTATITAEAVFLTSNVVTFRTGRAYRISLRALIQSNGTANNGGRFRLRKNNVSGTVLREWWDWTVFAATTGRNFAVDISTIATNTTGLDITAAVAATFLRDWGTDNLSIAGTSGTPTSLLIEDIGDASLVPGAQSIT
ncbi:hypothetical protein ACWCXE_27175 [Streptomyces sp. NPDC001780]